MDAYRDIALYEGPSGFEGAIGKIGRARYQVKELDERFRTVVESHPYRLTEKFELRPGEKISDYTFSVAEASVPNREWGVLVGEVVYNLRSALDHAAYAAAVKPSRDTQFPIFKRRIDYDKKSCGMVYSIPEKALSIIEQAQPYREPDPSTHILAVLNYLSNQDKHRLLHTTALTMGGLEPKFTAVRDIAAIHGITITFGPLEKDQKLVSIRLEPDGPDPKMEMKGNFALGVAFAEGPPSLEGEHVIGVLREILRAVTWAVGSLEAAVKFPE